MEWLTRLRRNRRAEFEELEIAQAISRARLIELFADPIPDVRLPGDPPAEATDAASATDSIAVVVPIEAPATAPITEADLPAPMGAGTASAPNAGDGIQAVVTMPAADAGVVCPTCSVVLDPPPRASRRCPVCRQRIVVRRRGGAVSLLTEAEAVAWDAARPVKRPAPDRPAKQGIAPG